MARNAFERRSPLLVCFGHDYESGLTRWEMAVPLLAGGEALGVLAGEALKDGAYTEEDLDYFSLFGGNVASSLHNADLVERARKDADNLRMKARDLAALNEIGLSLAVITDLDSVVKTTMDMAQRSLFFRSCALLLAENGDLVVHGVYGYRTEIEVGYRLPRGKGVSWRAFDSGQPVLVPEVGLDPDHVMGLPDARCEMVAPLIGSGGPFGVLVAESPKGGSFNATSLELFATFALQAAAAIQNARLHERNRDTFYETIRALAQALEMRDPYTRGHSERVTRFARRIGLKLEMSSQDLEVLEEAALLHDIGKIGVRDAVLLKPTELDAEERAAIERHPVIGDNILHPVGFLHSALEAVRHHHEHWNGKGYPSGLVGQKIPLIARIIGVADAYDAMTSSRPYREAMTHESAVAEIRRQANHQFDPDVVAAFLVTVGRTGPSHAEPPIAVAS